MKYLDSFYAIKHRYTHTMYFRDIELDIDGNVDVFKYAPPYLFSITKSKTDIYDVVNSKSGNVIYSIE